METFLLVVIAIFLVFLNGFFVAAEFAIVKLRMTQAEEMSNHYGWPGRILKNVRSHLDAYLAACQLGITIASLGLGWIGKPAFVGLLAPLFPLFGIESEAAIDGISFAAAFLIISYLHVVLGELAPKSVAIRRADITALWTATPLFLFYWVMYPFIWLLNGSALLILRSMGFDLAKEGDDAHSVNELKQMMLASHRHGELDKTETDIMSRTLEISDLTLGDLMRPHFDMVMLNLQARAEDNLRVIATHRFSRYPVYDGSREVIVGIAHIKDLFNAMLAGNTLSDLRPLLHEALIVDINTPAFRLLDLFREGYSHFAIIENETGNIIGFVTLEHLLAALFGQMRDEFVCIKSEWQRSTNDCLQGDGTLTLYSLEQQLGHEIESDTANTIGGLVMEKLDRLPLQGEKIEFDSFDVLIKQMSGPRISLLQVLPKSRQQVEYEQAD